MDGGGENSRVLTVREALFCGVPSSPTTVGHCDLGLSPLQVCPYSLWSPLLWQLPGSPSPSSLCSVRLFLAHPPTALVLR